MAENWWYRLLEVRRAGETFYVVQDDGPRPQQLTGPTAPTLTEYLQTLGRYGWEVCGTLAGEQGQNVIILKQRV